MGRGPGLERGLERGPDPAPAGDPGRGLRNPRAIIDGYPVYSPAERRADRAVHLAGLAAAALGAPLLLALALRWHGLGAVSAAGALYALTLVAMFAFSAAYHIIDDAALRPWLRRGDHAAIYAKIAGTYTPFVVLHGDAAAPLILVTLWLAAAAGMALKIHDPGRWEGWSVLLYLGLGWSILLIGLPVVRAMSPLGLDLAVAGGVLYTIGVAFHLWERLPYQNAVWHLHVLLATLLCFLAILVEIAAAAPG